MPDNLYFGLYSGIYSGNRLLESANRKRRIDIFSDEEPELMGIELMREFDILAEKFYGNFGDDSNEWSDSSEIYVGFGSEVLRREVNFILDGSYLRVRPTKAKTEPIPVSALDKTLESRTEEIEQVSS
jgi:hypothetical protein